jgi:hypothetical protein
MDGDRARTTTAIGLFLVSLAVLVLQIGLTRILSVTVWYHFSFAAVSLALLGMSAGAVVVYVRRARWLPAGRPAGGPLAVAAALFALSTAAAIGLYLQFDPRGGVEDGVTLLRLLPTLVFVPPFLLGGIVVSLVLTAWPRDVGRLYFWDLVGAGLGGVLIVVALDVLSGPTVILWTGVLAALAALLFALDGASRRVRVVAAVALAVTAAGALSNTAWGWLRIRYTKSYDEGRMALVHEEWGPLARLTVFEKHWSREGGVYGWGLSDAWRGATIPELWVEQDASAGTPITRYEGDPSVLHHLAYDVTSVVYHLRAPRQVAVIGLGGGRDALTALYFGARHVTGVEINPDMVDLVRERFADFAGHLFDDPRVTVVTADGRSFLAHSEERFDLIQVSLIDSWAASAAGAYVLAENSLYTVEAFDTYWQHLTDDGVLSISRWVMSQRPPELLRLASLALVTMRAHGVTEPGRHLVVVSYRNKVGSLLLRRTPFTDDELSRLRAVCGRMGFDVAWAPGAPDSWPAFADLVAAYGDLESYWASSVADVSPPTDDRPFFFLMLRLADALDEARPYELGLPYNATAVRTLGGLFVVVAGLVLLLILAPLQWFAKHGLAGAPHRGRFLLWFACIGLGFILVEIPLFQQFILFLGHPIYALSVVLATLLVASGIGSLLTDRVPPERALARARWALAAATALGLAAAFGLQPILDAALALPLAARIAVAVALVAPLGLVMGMPFPLGVKTIAAEGALPLVPWVWGVNGATSVLSTVLAFVVALLFGYTAALLVGVSCYAVATALVWTWRRGS